MRIWLEASLVARSGGSGSRRYTERLASGLAAAGEDVAVIASNGDFGAPRRPLRVGPRLLAGAWAVARWPSLTTVVGGGRPDVVHAVEKVSVPPVPRGMPLVVTVHDVWCLRRRTECGGLLRLLIRRSWRGRARWTLVLTPSQATREALAEFGFPPERVRVVPSGVDETFVGAKRDQLVLERFGLGPRTVLFVGPLSRKKGGDVLLEAMRLLRDAGMDDLMLAVRGPRDGTLEGAAWPAIRFLPPLRDNDLAALYASVAVVACPSREEGFNFPLVESLAAGGTVVASDIPVHREVSQAAAILVEPRSAEALARGIEQALIKGSPQVPFVAPRWEETVQETLAAYMEALTGG